MSIKCHLSRNIKVTEVKKAMIFFHNTTKLQKPFKTNNQLIYRKSIRANLKNLKNLKKRLLPNIISNLLRFKKTKYSTVKIKFSHRNIRMINNNR